MSKAARTKQAHHGGVTACTNHYTRSVQQLESVVEERLQQLSLLVAENSLLRRREAALQSAVTSLAGSVSAATQAVMVTSAADPAAALRATARAQPSDLRCSISDHKKFLLRMQQREAAVQRIMGQLDCGESKVELYSSWLLHRAFASPERASAHLATSKADRVAFVLATVQKLGLLVGKYDLLHHPATSMGTPREQLDRLVDELNERTLTFCLLAPPHRQLEMACLNMETGLPEAYPRGWWAVVIDAMQLSDDQKAALKICWEKVKPIKLSLTSKYEALSAQLTVLQRKQLDQQWQFGLAAEHAIDTAISRKAARQQQQHDLLQQQQQHGLQQQQQHDLQEQQQQHDLQQQQQQQPQPAVGQQLYQQQQVFGQQQQLQQQQELLRQQQQQLFHQQQQQDLLRQQQQQLIYQQQQQQQADIWAQLQQPAQAPLLQQQPQPQRRASLTDGLPSEHELFHFCRALLGSDIEGMEIVHDPFAPSKDHPGLAAIATSGPQPAAAAAVFGAGAEGQLSLPAAAAAAGGMGACGAPMLVDFVAPAAAPAPGLFQQQFQQQQQLGFNQGYAARMAPLQVQQAQQFVEFSPAVAAAAATCDQDLWLKGASPHSGGGGGLSPIRSGSEPRGSEGPGPSASTGNGTESNGNGHIVGEDVEDTEGMVVEQNQEVEEAVTPPEDSSQQRPSTSSTGAAGGPADSTGPVDSTSGHTASKSSLTPSSLSPSQPKHAVSAAAIATAAALAAAAEVIAADVGGRRMGPPGSGSVLDVCWQQELAPSGGFAGDLRGQSRVGGAGMGGAQELGGGGRQPLVLQSSDKEQRKLERQMDRITAQLKMQQYCMHTYVLNICSKKQIALKYVNCFPWVPESFSMCEALDEMGW